MVALGEACDLILVSTPAPFILIREGIRRNHIRYDGSGPNFSIAHISPRGLTAYQGQACFHCTHSLN